MTGSFPSLSVAGERRQARLRDARLGVVTDGRRGRGDLERLLRTVCDASVDVVHLRDATATEDELRASADVVHRVCDATGALFVLDALPGLALQVGADGVHVGRADVHADHARRTVGPDLLVGRSVHAAAEVDAAADEDVDYVSVGPVATTGDDLVRYAARHAAVPWFAYGGLDVATCGPVLALGARRVALDVAITEAADPAGAAWTIRRLLARHPL